jgi:hypothetical protein
VACGTGTTRAVPGARAEGARAEGARRVASGPVLQAAVVAVLAVAADAASKAWALSALRGHRVATPALLGTSSDVTMPRSAAQQASSSAATFFPTPVGAFSIRVGPAGAWILVIVATPVRFS